MALPVMRTLRILLGPWSQDDIDALHALFIAPEVRRYLWDDTIIARDTVEQLLASHLEISGSHNIGYWTLRVSAPESITGAPLDGFCGFRFIDASLEIELLYGLRGELWGRGLATEACAAALNYLWRATAFPRVHARTDPPNAKSVEVMRRLGMTHQSTTESLVTYLLVRPESYGT